MPTKAPSRRPVRKAPELRKSILVLHGPNLNLLGTREPQHYGISSLDEINQTLLTRGAAVGISVENFQSNHEGALIDRIHQAGRDGVDFILINPAGLTHTSVALRDALAAAAIPFIEVHLSNVHTREAFRHHSYFSDLAIGVIAGLGSQGYELALEYALRHLHIKVLNDGSQKTEKTH
jgi:3-dehydroquinate dehydratase II